MVDLKTRCMLREETSNKSKNNEYMKKIPKTNVLKTLLVETPISGSLKLRVFTFSLIQHIFASVKTLRSPSISMMFVK